MTAKDSVHLDAVSDRSSVVAVAFDQINEHVRNISVVFDYQDFMRQCARSTGHQISWLLRGYCHMQPFVR
ncbi:hypothetical protein AGR1B_pa0142 [Agrobacterium fabacearum S56]|nr:hypothetical protein AGR1B_pa0142 [Agrobacterium fabacearum S56]